LILLIVSAFQIRCLFDNEVFHDGGVHFIDGDSSYHMRRVDLCLKDYPRIPAFDSYMGYPEGALCPWPPLYDLLAASVIKGLLAVTGRGLSEAARFAAYFNPVLGSLILLPVYFFTRKLFSSAAGLAACAVLAVLSGHIHYARLGNFDHHEALSFFSFLFMAAVTGLTWPPGDADAASRRRMIFAVLAGLFIAAAILTWTGCIFFAALAEIYFLYLLIFSGRKDGRALLPAIMVLHAVWMIATLPFAATSPWSASQPFSLIMLSWFHVALPAAALLYFFYLFLIGRSEGMARRRVITRRLVLYLALPLLFAAGACLLLPPLREALQNAFVWFSKSSAFMSRVPESQPLFFQRGRFTTVIASARLSYFFYLSPPILVWILCTRLKEKIRDPILFFVFWTVALTAVTLIQKRFFNCLALNIAVMAGFALTASHALLRKRIGAVKSLAALIILSVLLLRPSIQTFLPRIWGHDDLIWKLRGGGMAPEFYRSLEAACLWLRENTPTTSFYDAPVEKPEYGIFANWSWGHSLVYVARRPSVANNFGDYVNPEGFMDSIRFGGLLEEEEAVAMLQKYGAPYVITTVNMVPCVDGARAQNALRHMAHRLHWVNGSALPVPLMGGRYSVTPEPLRHFRLLYETGDAGECLGLKTAMVKVFERVPGARLSIRSEPWEEVSLALPLETNQGGRFVYRAAARGDKEGRSEIIVPYATQRVAGRTNAAGLYEITSADRRAELAVSESDVLEGNKLHADLTAGPAD
jgi:dolichyl-diphosphooligosaccharide--protein glycosyltransferase